MSEFQDWAITLPQNVSWADYEKELEAVAAGATMNYRVPRMVSVQSGDRIFIVWRGQVRGWMEALGCIAAKAPWVCSTTGVVWPAGYYVQRGGRFQPVDGPPMKGFRGIRRMYFKEDL